MYQDAALDASGWSPEAAVGSARGALARLLDLAARLPFEEAVSVASSFGIQTSASALERLMADYAGECRETVAELLAENEAPRLADEEARISETPGRLLVLSFQDFLRSQLDGVYTLGRPSAGSCPGVEIKSAVLYPQAAPKERFMLADVVTAQDLLPRVAGLLRRAEVKPQDILVGLGDGAPWVENILDTLGAIPRGFPSVIRITDVYHGCEYLDTVMSALAWDEAARAQHRRAWCRGEVSAKDWLEEHLPDPGIWLAWDEEQQAALEYLEKRLGSMDYPTFKAKGYPIGSGQIEGMNKAVIGHRLKRSGMHWWPDGAARMACTRAQFCAKHPLVSFQQLRHRAYPPVPA